MITDVIDRTESISSTKGNLKNIPTFPNSEVSENASAETTEYKISITRNQWKYAKENLKQHLNVRTLLQVGDLYDFRDNYKRALGYYQQALLMDVENISIYKKIIDVLVKHKEFDEAELYFKKILNITNRYEILKDYVLFKVVSFQDFSNINLLIDLIDKTLEKSETDIDLISLKGFLLLNFKKEIKLAKKFFEKCLEINPNYIHAINNLGVSYLREGDKENAEKYFKLAVDISPYDYPFAFQNLINVYIAQGKKKEAIELLDIAIFKNIPLDYEYQHMYGWLLLNDLQFTKAKSWYQNLIQREKHNNLLYNNLGVCYSKEGNTNAAILAFEKAVTLCKEQVKQGVTRDPRSLHAFYNRARMALETDELSIVKEMAENILSMNSDDAYGFYFLGIFFLKTGKYAEAENAFEKALSINKNISEIYPDYSFLLSSTRREYKKAIKIILEGLELGYKNDYLYNNLAFALIKNGDLTKGEKVLNEHIGSPLPTFIATRGLLEIKKGHIEDGVAYYEEAIKKLSGFHKKIAKKILETELADYWYIKNDYRRAKECINKAKMIEGTYMDFEVQEMDEKIQSKLIEN